MDLPIWFAPYELIPFPCAVIAPTVAFAAVAATTIYSTAPSQT